MSFRDNAAPLVGDGVIYSGPHALRAADGHIIWTTTAGSNFVAFHALVGGVLYGNDEEHIVAVNAKVGSARWTYTSPTRDPPGGRLIVADRRVYFGTLDPDSAMYALDASSGSLLWNSTTPAYGDATLLNDTLYFGSANKSVYAVRASTGGLLWSWRSPSSVPTNTEVTGANGTLYVVMDGLDALDATAGALHWHQPLDAPLEARQSTSYTPATVAGNVVYLARVDGYGNGVLYALNAATGAIFWQTSPLPLVTPVVVG
jgi:eukaryotic-like serine/threonine-protein kinase